MSDSYDDETNNNIAVEEVWMTSDGANVFSLEPEFELNELHFSSLPNTTLKYKCFTENMTPLDCLYQDEEKNTNEFYDGTGNLVWLAALGFGHVLNENCSNIIQKYLGKRICELGCGTGVAGIAALLFSSDEETISQVLFTDNDGESLDLCQTNCELNDDWLEKNRYSRQILSWGEPSTYPTTDDDVSVLMDTILATDVLYDMVMIPLLMETAATLLMDGGHVLLSHVPRFCLPKREQQQLDDDKVEESQESSGDPFQALEVHILEQATKVGLELVETIRLHEALTTLPRIEEEVKTLSSSPPPNTLSLERFKDMHAVLFVFQKKKQH